MTPIASVADMKKTFIAAGCETILIKVLADNDNSKQQIYLGSSFDVLKILPSGKTCSSGISASGPIFKSAVKLSWISSSGATFRAPGAQLILYPKYPEVRLSGFLKGCERAPSHLMQPPTKEERRERAGKNRVLFLGINDDEIFCYVSGWDDQLSIEGRMLVNSANLEVIGGTLNVLCSKAASSKELLLKRLADIYELGMVDSCRLDKNGTKIPYQAKNGAGYTLESLFGITPNGNSEPDFDGWELKAHSGSVVTLMTPEPDRGDYQKSLWDFLQRYGTSIRQERIDFASIHRPNEYNRKTSLTLLLEGYDGDSRKIVDPDGGLNLRDNDGNLAAGWSFSKLIDHWKCKHARACYVHYKKSEDEAPKYHFGPIIRIAEGAGLEKFIHSIFERVVYYDPGINMKLVDGNWKSKKRNQFRAKWANLVFLYEKIEDHDVS